MKQKLYILGLITTLVICSGVIFKVNHYPGAGYLLTIGLTVLAIFFIPAALMNNYQDQENGKRPLLYFVTGLTCFVLFTAMLFKVQHWPGAGIALTIAVPFPYVVFLPVFLVETSGNRNFNIYNTVFVLLLLAMNSVFSALLALNVEKVRIDDSLNLARNYTRLETVLNSDKEEMINNPVAMNINDVLKIVAEYRDLILKQEGISYEQWKANPELLRRPDAMMVAGVPLLKNNETYPGEKLEVALNCLVSELNKDQHYEMLARFVPSIFEFKPGEHNKSQWVKRMFQDNNLSWALIYLDSLEVNLKMVLTSASLLK